MKNKLTRVMGGRPSIRIAMMILIVEILFAIGIYYKSGRGAWQLAEMKSQGPLEFIKRSDPDNFYERLDCLKESYSQVAFDSLIYQLIDTANSELFSAGEAVKYVHAHHMDNRFRSVCLVRLQQLQKIKQDSVWRDPKYGGYYELNSNSEIFASLKNVLSEPLGTPAIN